MNDLTVRSACADALRPLLLEQVVAKKPGKRRRWWIGMTAVAVLTVSGTAGIAAANLATPPGTPIVTSLGTPAAGTFTGTGTLDLGPVPSGANGIKVTVTCLTAGSFTFGDFGTMVCADGDVNRVTWGTVPLGLAQQRTVTFTTAPDATWAIEAEYTETIETDWGVNEAGQTYGAPKGAEDPDLIPVTATNCQRGYADATLLASMSPTGMTWEEGQEYIDGVNRFDRSVPVYSSDGRTVIGEFIVPGTDSPPLTIACL